jgi:NOL1/NOP2/sun family putative RNA methylase
MIRLPDAFRREMTELLSRFGRADETGAFFDALQAAPRLGLRANTLKIEPHVLRGLLVAAGRLPADAMAPVAWSDDGFYYPEELQPGRLPYYAAGLYYIQEPSAMLPAMVLAARPGERVLDLCAAPGGKTCKIAADLRGEGLLWSNEISHERARALLHNVELTGCTNCLITRESPERLAAVIEPSAGALFDKILVDAPCSGTGMFRRDPSAIASWLAYGSEHYTALQRQILAAAWRMLRPGGTLVYSTCTFALAENEAMIAWLLDQQDDCRIDPVTKWPGVSDGLPLSAAMTGTARIWPHLAAGEGHFCARLVKCQAQKAADQAQTLPIVQNAAYADTTARSAAGRPAASEPPEMERRQAWAAFTGFCQTNLTPDGQAKLERLLAAGQGRYEAQNLHILPPGLELPARLSKAKTGLFLGQVRPLASGRAIYEPSQSFLYSLRAEDLKYSVAGDASSELIQRYLRGETLACPPDPADHTKAGESSAEPAAALPGAAAPDAVPPQGGYAAVLLAQAAGSQRPAWPLGWTKIQDGRWLKNLYPKAWRNNA